MVSVVLILELLCFLHVASIKQESLCRSRCADAKPGNLFPASCERSDRRLHNGSVVRDL